MYISRYSPAPGPLGCFAPVADTQGCAPRPHNVVLNVVTISAQVHATEISFFGLGLTAKPADGGL